jgi:hypothetical protein
MLVEPSLALFAATTRGNAEHGGQLSDDVAEPHGLLNHGDPQRVTGLEVELVVRPVAPQLYPVIGSGYAVDDPFGELFLSSVLP